MAVGPNWFLIALIALVLLAVIGAIVHFTSKD
jgi:hypothetical protein